MPKLYSVATLLMLATIQSSASQAVPQFADYPSTVQMVRQAAGLRLTDSTNRRYATHLNEASQRPIDFAGRYVLAEWGCGAACVMAAAINTKTGKVVMLPFTVSNWPLDVIEPLAYRKDSALLIVRGSRNERGKGTYYYHFDGKAFKLLSSDDSAQRH